MSAAMKLNLVSVEDYLAGELTSPIKHEYFGGVVFAMSGARNRHNLIKNNVLGSTWARLRGKRCKPFDSDTKIRVQLANEVRFYYPDDSIICSQNSLEVTFQDKPVVIFEVLSKSTRRIDQGEKKDAYLTIPSLKVYVMLEQDSATAVVYRKSRKGFVREVYAGLDAVLPLSEVGTELPFSEIYEDVEFFPEPGDVDEE